MKRIQNAGLLAGLLLAVALIGLHAPRARSDEGSPAAVKPPSAGAAEHQHHDMGSMGEASKALPDRGEYKTIVGEVMDPACFLEAGEKSIGPGHYQCAVDCARSGQTLAVYDRVQDRIYFVAGELPNQNPNAPLLPYIHKKVDVTGRVFHRSDAWGIVIVKVVPHQGTAQPAAVRAK